MTARKHPSKPAWETRLRREIIRRQKAEKRLVQALQSLKETRQSLVELKGLQVASEEAQGLGLDELLVTINHQMRAPLNALVNAIGLLRDSALSSEQMDWVDVANHSARSLLYQLNQLRELGQLELQGLELEPSDASVADLIDDVVDLFRNQVQSERLVLFAQLDPEAAIRVSCDVGRLRQILINMMAYALTFRGGDQVLLHTRRDGDNFVFSVSAPAPEAGERKSAAVNLRSDEEQQLVPEDPGGLALVITDRLVGLMGGEVSSRVREDQGLQIEASLPLKRARRSRDRYIESLKKALSTLDLVVIGPKRKAPSLVLSALERWGVSHPRVRRARNLEASPGKSAVAIAEGTDTKFLRAAARRGIRAVGIISQNEPHASSDDSLDTLTEIRLPMSERALLEHIVAPSLRRFDPKEVDAIPRSRNPVHALVAEDSLANRMITVRMLEKMGHRAYGVADGREAVTAASKIEFDLILMDLRMPVLDGIDAARAILEDDGNSKPPIVALTGHTTREIKKACLEAGMSDFLAKPIEPVKLAKAVEVWGREGRMTRLKEGASRHQSLPLLERGALIRMRNEVDASLIPEMGSIFLSELQGKLADARRLVDKERHGLVAKVLHPLRSTAASFGARQLVEVIRQIEKSVEAEETELTEQLLEVLGEVTEKTSEQLQLQFKEIAKNGGH